MAVGLEASHPVVRVISAVQLALVPLVVVRLEASQLVVRVSLAVPSVRAPMCQPLGQTTP